MTIGFDAWYALAGGLGLVWFFRLVILMRAARTRCVLTELSDGMPDSDVPSVSIIVAAKDEEANIESCISTLLEQDYADFELIAVDDRSDDRTPEILDRLRADANRRFRECDEAIVPGGNTPLPNGLSSVNSGERLRVIRIQSLREGWFGKNNAMREGIAASRGEWLMFTDADCRFDSRRTLSIAMREAAIHDADLLSITPVLETPTCWERIIQPVCALVLMLWFRPERVNDPSKTAAYANGAFMLMRRSCYDAVGGHERVRAELNEDIQLARIVKREGYNLRIAENDGLFQTRMYDSIDVAWRGWSRIFYGSLNTFRRLAVSMLMIVVYTFIPWISLAIALIGWSGRLGAKSVSWETAVVVWLSVIVLQQAFLWRFYGMVKIQRAWSLIYPVGAIVALGMLFSAMLKVFGATGTTWRGTTYPGGRSIAEGESVAATAKRAAVDIIPNQSVEQSTATATQPVSTADSSK